MIIGKKIREWMKEKVRTGSISLKNNLGTTMYERVCLENARLYDALKHVVSQRQKLRAKNEEFFDKIEEG